MLYFISGFRGISSGYRYPNTYFIPSSGESKDNRHN